MKTIALAVSLLALMATAARADSDDAKWIAQCIKDNAGEKVSAEVIKKYCTCMNNKMDDNETRTITEWEKTHPKERADCDRQSGWK